MPALSFLADNVHDVRVGERRVLFHIPTTALFDLDDVGGAVLDLTRRESQSDQLTAFLPGDRATVLSYGGVEVEGAAARPR